MYVTGSDAWKSQKQMSEGRIGGQSLREVRRVYPTRPGRQPMAGAVLAPKRDFQLPEAEPFAYSGAAPIFGS